MANEVPNTPLLEELEETEVVRIMKTHDDRFMILGFNKDDQNTSANGLIFSKNEMMDFISELYKFARS